MGSVRLGPPEDLVLALRDTLGATAFLETGTWKGGTAEWAARHFQQAVTIEGDDARYEKTAARLSGTPRLRLVRGDSRTRLAPELRRLSDPAILWLDAHWCGGGAAQAHALGDECPLREELEQLNALASRGDAVLVDDARLFANPPPYPHDPAQWPNLQEVLRLLLPGRRVWVNLDEDILVALPGDAPAAAVAAVDAWIARTAKPAARRR
jgi:hypothetical protein